MRPLSDILRPNDISEMVGQEHLISKGKPLYSIATGKNIPNMIFFGPSGCGKTTFANIISKQSEKKLYKLNATTASIADIKQIIQDLNVFTAPNGILLYLDEIQYFNKKQQQSLLEFIENGSITLIASTTENPYFYVYNAILSRCTVFEFKPVKPESLRPFVLKAIAYMENQLGYSIVYNDEQIDYICVACGGDVRKALNSIEMICLTLRKDSPEITMELVQQCTQKSAMRYDRDGDYHYDILSAFQKSIRGSEVNAALHYLARLIEADNMPSICRRLMVIASEDIGLAYPIAAAITKACVDSAQALGFPEARLPLAQAVILLATAPKSNSVITSIDAALADVRSGQALSIPANIQDSHYGGAKQLGHGVGYKYAHDYKNNYVEQQYMPDEIKDHVYYHYGNNKMEQATKEYWKKIKGEK